jgi:hypothetical protein
MSSSPILSAELRAWHYWFEDGLPTLVAGIGCLLGAIFFGYDDSGSATPLTMTVGLLACVLYCALLIFQRQIIDWLKSKITYPRTGYAQPPYFQEQVSQPLDIMHGCSNASEDKPAAEIEALREYRKQRMLLTCGAAGVALLAMRYIHNRWICALAGIIMGLAFCLWGRKVYRLSWVVIGGFPFLGFMLGMVFGDRLRGTERVTYFLFGVGVILVLDGISTLLQYLRANPRATPERP